MKISCQSCAAKYTIADAKVSGRIVKIKCKKCASTIVVNGNELVTGGMAAAPAHAPMPSLHEIPAGLGALGSRGGGAGDDADTRIMAEGEGGEAPSDEWTVSITDDDQRSMTTEQVVSEYANGSLNQDTYLWRDGMGDWLPLFDVPELQPLLAAAAGDMPPSSAAPFSDPGAPSSGGQSPFDVPSAGADLFGAGPASASQPPASDDARHVGERNENSVLFSLSALTAAEDAASKESSSASPSRPPGARSSVIDIAGPPRPSNGRSNRKAGLDEIMNIGGGAIGASPMLAPPDLLAPVKEPEPPPPPPAPISMAPGSMPVSQAMPVSSPMMMPEQKKPMGLYIGLGAGGLLLLIVVIVLATSGGEETQPVAQNTSTESADKTDTDTGTATTDTTAKPDEASSTDTSTDTSTDEEGDEDGDEEGDEDVEDPGENATEEQKKAFLEAKKKAAAAKTDKPEASDEPKKKKKKKKAEPEDTSDKPKGEFNRGAAMAALGGAAGAAQGCAKKGGPTGSGKARVTFAPSGRATSATVGGPFSGTSVGSCVAGIFRGASVPPFKGGAVTVSKSFRIK